MRSCFIIAPMTTPNRGTYTYKDNHFDKMRTDIWIPAVKEAGFTPTGPFREGTFSIWEEILAQLRGANLVLCDISSWNANVLFELGIRRTLNKAFAIIKDKPTKLPFDLKNFNCHQYDPTVVYKSKQSKERLIRELAQHLRQTPGNKRSMTEEHVAGAAACGISQIYASREAAMTDILEAMKDARRLWIMGVGLSERFQLIEQLDAIEDRIQEARDRGKKRDVRVLILDALTSTGVFRSLLECESHQAKEIVNASRKPGDERPGDPYFDQRVYQDFYDTWKRFRGRNDIDNIVRFYGHAPSGWLLIADETAYYQPYTFGSDPDSKRSAGKPIGPLMPVFRFARAGNTRPFRILEDHFRRLWLTTDTDLFHVRARHAEARDTLFKIFDKRGYWLKQVNYLLHAAAGDRRQYPRRVCKSELENSVRRDTKLGTTQDAVKVEVLNFSREGLAIRLKLKLKVGDPIKIFSRIPRRPKPLRGKEEAGAFVKKMLVDPYDGRFRVKHKRKDGEFLIVGLHPIKTKAK